MKALLTVLHLAGQHISMLAYPLGFKPFSVHPAPRSPAGGTLAIPGDPSAAVSHQNEALGSATVSPPQDSHEGTNYGPGAPPYTTQGCRGAKEKAVHLQAKAS